MTAFAPPRDPIEAFLSSLGSMLAATRTDDEPENAAPTVDPRVAAAAGGDRQACEALLTELAPRIRNLVRYLVKGDADADDIAQEALITVLKGFRTFRGDGSLRSWADRITARVTFAAIKKRKREPSQLPSDDAPELFSVGDDGNQPDEYLYRRRLATLLDRIPQEQRDALILHHAVGMSVPELADFLDIPFETARSRLRIGAKKLRMLRDESQSASSKEPEE